MIRALILLLLSIFPHMSHDNHRCIERRVDEIERQARDASSRHNVPPAILLSVAFNESHLGCDERDWGAPSSSRSRHAPGTPDDAARALANAYAACGSWRGAITRFRSGLCNASWLSRPELRVDVTRYVDRVTHLSRRLEVYASTLGDRRLE